MKRLSECPEAVEAAATVRFPGLSPGEMENLDPASARRVLRAAEDAVPTTAPKLLPHEVRRARERLAWLRDNVCELAWLSGMRQDDAEMLLDPVTEEALRIAVEVFREMEG